MHNYRSDSNFFYKCPKPKCHSSFQKEPELKAHLRIHNNDFETCQYCPFKYIRKNTFNYRNHLNRHFGVKDFKCDQCGKLFLSKLLLNQHYAIHEGISYNCLLCGYKASIKPTMHTHLSRKHPEVVGKNFNWESVDKFVKISK